MKFVNLTNFLKIYFIFFGLTLNSFFANVDRKPKIVLIGVMGKQGQEYFDLLKNYVQFTAFVVSSYNSLNINHQLIDICLQNNIKILVGIEELKKALEDQQIDFDIAILTIPHHLHNEFTTLLLKNNSLIIKEKPLAMNKQEILDYEMKFEKLPILTIVQRHFDTSIINAKNELSLIGNPIFFSYKYYLNLPNMTSGWRADKLKCGGGVIMDMGYHIIDVINDFFGMPLLDKISAHLNFFYKEMLEEKLEDKATIYFEYATGLKGKIKISRHDQKKEELIIKGTLGTIRINPNGYTVYDLNNDVIKSFVNNTTKEEIKLKMMNSYIENRLNQQYIDEEFKRHKANVYIIDQIYKNAVCDMTIIKKVNKILG